MGVEASGVLLGGVLRKGAEAMPLDDLRGGRGALPVLYWLGPYDRSLCESSLEGTPGCSPSAVRFEDDREGKFIEEPSVRIL